MSSWRGMGLMGLLLLLSFGCQQTSVDEQPPTPLPQMEPKADVIIEGLINPVGIEPLPDGSLLIAEEGTGERDNSSGITLRMADGQHGRLISNLPSSRDSGDLSGVPFVRWRDGTLFTSYFNLGHLATLPLNINTLQLPDTPFSGADLGQQMVPLNAVQLRNPFDMTFDGDGVPVVSDATENGVAKMTEDGRTRFFHRFDALPNPGAGQTMVDAVPTGIAAIGNEYWVTLTTGCPYPPTAGRVVAIDESRNQRTVVDGLSMPIDVVQDANGTVWVLEFARFRTGGDCFSGQDYQPHTGKLSKIDKGEVVPVLTGLDFPASMAFDSDGRLLISELSAGRVIQISGVEQIETPTPLPSLLGEPLTEPPSSPEPEAAFPLQFVNRAAELGLDFQHGAFNFNLSADPIAMMGGGLCWLDYDNDGWEDLYLVNSYALAERPFWDSKGGLPTNQLFWNQNGTFVDVSQSSQTNLTMRGNGCIAADFNNDGWTDLYVTADGPNALLWNEQDGTFREGAAQAGVDLANWNASAAAGDLNQDGWLDLFVTAYIDLENQIENPVGAFPQDYYGLPDHLFLNNGDGSFRDVSTDVGLTREERGLGAVLSDFDNDGDLDLYIANDGHPNRLYSSEVDSSESGFRFIDLSLTSGTNDSGSGMGVAAGDYDSDGRIDLFVTNWDTELNALYRNQIDETGNLTFRYSTHRIGISGLGNNKTGWGTAWADFDNDGDEDLLVVNGHVPITDLEADAQLVRLYGNLFAQSSSAQFQDWTQLVGLGQTQLGPLHARGSAVADFDNDGDLDIAINQIGGRAVLLVNESQPRAWLGVELPGALPGTTVRLELADGRFLTQELRIGSSYLASEDPRLHFGLGDNDSPVSLTVLPPFSQPLVYRDVAPNQYVKITESSK